MYLTAWDPRALDTVEHDLRKLEDSVKISSGNFVDDQHRPSQESLVGGLANVSELSKESYNLHFMLHKFLRNYDGIEQRVAEYAQARFKYRGEKSIMP